MALSSEPTTATPRDSVGRVVFVGDSHGNVLWLCHVISQCASWSARRIIQVGDFGIWPGLSGADFVAKVSAAAVEHGVRVDFIDGNHDDHDQLEELYGHDAAHHFDGSVILAPGVHWWPRGQVTEMDGKRVGFLGGAVSVDRNHRTPHKSWWEQESVTSQDVQALIDRVGDVALDVLVTHDAPLGAPVYSSSSRWPSDVLSDARVCRSLVAEAVEYTRPQLVVHGHWHQRYQADYKVGDTHSAIVGLGYEDSEALVVVDLASLDVDDLGQPLLWRT